MKATQRFQATNEGMLYSIDVEVEGRLLRSDLLVSNHEVDLGGIPAKYIEQKLRDNVMYKLRKELFPCGS